VPSERSEGCRKLDIDLRQVVLNGKLDADFFETGKQFPPMVVSPQQGSAGATGINFGNRSPHGVGQKRGEVVHGGPILDLLMGDQNPIRVHTTRPTYRV